MYSAKRQLLGNTAGRVPPAWRDQKPKEGSKILISRLPPDVGALEVEELFCKTVGPLKEVFLIHNSQGHSKGMAIVAFQRPGDAAVARTKYDGKFIDGRRPIKIEMVLDTTQPVPVAQTQPSLLGRLSVVATPAPTPSARKQPAVTPRRRHKKGPRRAKKTLAQLDQEMEDYRAASFVPNGK